MQPTKRNQGGQQGLLRSRLDQIVDLAHPLATPARSVDWSFLEQRRGAVYTDGRGRLPLSTQLMAGLAILKHMHNLSDEIPLGSGDAYRHRTDAHDPEGPVADRREIASGAGVLFASGIKPSGLLNPTSATWEIYDTTGSQGMIVWVAPRPNAWSMMV
jgi:hypothetical protein